MNRIAGTILHHPGSFVLRLTPTRPICKTRRLGELTAGIAHEIQNPLNFVNNFSSLNKELIEELQHEA